MTFNQSETTVVWGKKRSPCHLKSGETKARANPRDISWVWLGNCGVMVSCVHSVKEGPKRQSLSIFMICDMDSPSFIGLKAQGYDSPQCRTPVSPPFARCATIPKIRLRTQGLCSLKYVSWLLPGNKFLRTAHRQNLKYQNRLSLGREEGIQSKELLLLSPVGRNKIWCVTQAWLSLGSYSSIASR
jgi:hypothetical protein